MLWDSCRSSGRNALPIDFLIHTWRVEIFFSGGEWQQQKLLPSTEFKRKLWGTVFSLILAYTIHAACFKSFHILPAKKWNKHFVGFFFTKALYSHHLSTSLMASSISCLTSFPRFSARVMQSCSCFSLRLLPPVSCNEMLKSVLAVW